MRILFLGRVLIYLFLFNGRFGVTDLDALISYTEHLDPIYQGLDGRITVLN